MQYIKKLICWFFGCKMTFKEGQDNDVDDCYCSRCGTCGFFNLHYFYNRNDFRGDFESRYAYLKYRFVDEWMEKYFPKTCKKSGFIITDCQCEDCTDDIPF